MNAAAPRLRRRVLFLGLVSAVFVLAGLHVGSHWLLEGRFEATTDNAYVGGNVVPVMSRIAGTVVEIDADETMRVARGETLLRLDDASLKIGLELAEAELAEAVRRVRRLFDDVRRLQSRVDLRAAELDKARQDLHRRQRLTARNVVAIEDLDHARAIERTARAALDLARHELESANSLVDGTSVVDHPLVQQAKARLREASLALGRTVIRSAVDGYVAKRAVQLGQRVEPGTPLLAVVPLGDLWVDANFKESELRDMRIGQPVILSADLYGEDVRFRGSVTGLGAGTGSVFSLLPAQNATGNWIKVVQRVPVRIALQRTQIEAHPLRVGLSMRVSIDMHDTTGPVLAPALRRGPVYATPAVAQDDAAVEARIDAIITANAGPAVPGGAVAGQP
ncbi:MAG: efflux RND transporter periplasmic adaptor subunit [Gammaproteobacteria bacterium]|nr:efflux RND transporter periplasmic adaptor subunit [Gammaproteobacteria bacterium]